MGLTKYKLGELMELVPPATENLKKPVKMYVQVFPWVSFDDSKF